MIDRGDLPTSCGVAIPLSDVVVDDFEDADDDAMEIEDDLMILSPWSMCYGGRESDRELARKTFEHFWIARDRSMFLEEATLGVCGVVRGHPDFPQGVRVTGLKIKRLVRISYGSVELPEEQLRVARDLIIIVTEEGVRFGIYSDNASRLGES